LGQILGTTIEDEDEGHYRRRGYHGKCFRAEDIRVIHEYYYRDLSPGLKKKLYRTGQLPPGWQKNSRDHKSFIFGSVSVERKHQAAD
jgi:hypothetical protein